MKRFSYHSGAGNISYLRREGEIPVVLIHGFTASAYIWRSVVSRMDRSLDITCVDLYGHGKSDMPNLSGVELNPRSVIHFLASSISELMDALGMGSYHVAGSSMGGWIALELATGFRKPETAVLIDSAGLMTVTDRKFATGFFGLLEEYSRKNRRMGRALMSMVQNASPDQLTIDPVILGMVDFPTCVIWGSEDRILDPSYGRKLAGTIPRSEFHLIEGGEHVPFRSHPSEVAGIMNGFILKN